MEDVHEEPLFVQRVAGLDIAKAEVEVTVRVPSDTSSGRRQQATRTFGTTRRQLLELADWLRSWGVTKVGMEATSDYRPQRGPHRPRPCVSWLAVASPAVGGTGQQARSAVLAVPSPTPASKETRPAANRREED
jgi:hypothetical protein